MHTSLYSLYEEKLDSYHYQLSTRCPTLGHQSPLVWVPRSHRACGDRVLLPRPVVWIDSPGSGPMRRPKSLCVYLLELCGHTACEPARLLQPS